MAWRRGSWPDMKLGEYVYAPNIGAYSAASSTTSTVSRRRGRARANESEPARDAAHTEESRPSARGDGMTS